MVASLETWSGRGHMIHNDRSVVEHIRLHRGVKLERASCCWP